MSQFELIASAINLVTFTAVSVGYVVLSNKKKKQVNKKKGRVTPTFTNEPLTVKKVVSKTVSIREVDNRKNKYPIYRSTKNTEQAVMPTTENKYPIYRSMSEPEQVMPEQDKAMSDLLNNTPLGSCVAKPEPVVTPEPETTSSIFSELKVIHNCLASMSDNVYKSVSHSLKQAPTSTLSKSKQSRQVRELRKMLDEQYELGRKNKKNGDDNNDDDENSGGGTGSIDTSNPRVVTNHNMNMLRGNVSHTAMRLHDGNHPVNFLIRNMTDNVNCQYRKAYKEVTMHSVSYQGATEHKLMQVALHYQRGYNCLYLSYKRSARQDNADIAKSVLGFMFKAPLFAATILR